MSKCGDEYCSYCGDYCSQCGLHYNSRQRIEELEKQVLYLQGVITDVNYTLGNIIKIMARPQ